VTCGSQVTSLPVSTVVLLLFAYNCDVSVLLCGKYLFYILSCRLLFVSKTVDCFIESITLSYCVGHLPEINMLGWCSLIGRSYWLFLYGKFKVHLVSFMSCAV